MHGPMLFILPIFMCGFMTRFWGKNKSWAEGFKAWKFCILASICFGVPYYILAWTVGPELPSLIGGLIGLAIVMQLAKKGVCVPAEVWDFEPAEKWNPEWIGEIKPSDVKEFKEHMPQVMAWMPYALCGLILVVTRVPAFHLKPIVTDPMWSVGATNILGQTGVGAKIALLNLPGTIPFILVAILTIFMHGMMKDHPDLGSGRVGKAWSTAFAKMKAPTIALMAAVALVSIFKGTGVSEATGGVSMPMAMAKCLADLVGEAWPGIASYVGGLGAFITGSNTVSDMLFANFQWDMSQTLKYTVDQTLVIIAAQGAGGAMGNMVCVHNIVAACAVTGLIGKEGDILRRTFMPFVLYGVAVGVVAFVLM